MQLSLVSLVNALPALLVLCWCGCGVELKTAAKTASAMLTDEAA